MSAPSSSTSPQINRESIAVCLDGCSTPLSSLEAAAAPSSSMPSMQSASIFLRLKRREGGRATLVSLLRRICACFSSDEYDDEVGAAAPSSARSYNQFYAGTVAVSAPIHKIVEFTYELVPELDKVFGAAYYWGRMDRYQAEQLLRDQPEGTFLLRDSEQPEFLFSVSFRRYKRTLHARIEQGYNAYGFDIHDECAFKAPTITKLIDNYSDHTRCLFFEPQLTNPLLRNTVFSLRELARSSILAHIRYKDIASLPLPLSLIHYLAQDFHYAVPVRTIRPHPSNA